jgi:hypothetical protein
VKGEEEREKWREKWCGGQVRSATRSATQEEKAINVPRGTEGSGHWRARVLGRRERVAGLTRFSVLDPGTPEAPI